jgi:ribonuclease T1
MKACIFALSLLWSSFGLAATCQQVAQTIAQQKPISATELTTILNSLNQKQRLPEQFVTKKQAKSAGWQPGESLWIALPGKSMGGDRLGNREERLPEGRYFEADLDYQGKKRNAKRFVYQITGPRYITTDHYATFIEVPPCQ